MKKKIKGIALWGVLVIAVVLVALFLSRPIHARKIHGTAEDRLGGFSGDGGAAQDDSVKASMDLAHTDLDTIITDTGTTLDNLIRGMCADLNVGAGSIFYVDSGVDGTTGVTPATAVGTLDEGVNLCTADAGDVIVVMPGHNEALTAADGVDCDVNGITVIGMGRGQNKPTFDYDNANGEFVIGAHSVTIINLRFRVSANATTKAIDVESAGDDFAIINCEFGYAETASDEFASAIIVGDTANDGLIKGCTFRAGGQAAVQAIYIDADIVGITIEDNDIWGDYSKANIFIEEASDDVIIRRNLLFNGTMGGDGEIGEVEVLEAADSTAGLVANNLIVSDVATTLLMRVADDMVFMHNVVSDTDGDEFSGSLEDAAFYSEDANSVAGHADG